MPNPPAARAADRQDNLLHATADWIRSIPRVTRALFLSIVVVSCGGSMGLVDPRTLIYEPQLAFGRLQVWRTVTSFFFCPFGPGLPLTLYYVYKSSRDLEDQAPTTADYAYTVFCVMAGVVAAATALGWPVIFTNTLMMALTYLWAMARRDQVVSFFFGIRFKAMYLPLVLIGFDLIQAQLDWAKLLGLAVGHAVYYVQAQFPSLGRTPALFHRLIPPPPDADAHQPSANGAYYRHAPTADARAAAPAGGLRYRWGAGQRLGTD